MKKTITVRLCVVIALSMIAAAALTCYIQIRSAKEAADSNAQLRINQVKEILAENNKQIEELKENLKEDFFIRAKAAAYIVQNQPEVIGDLAETRKIAALLQVDELHLFDTSGRLYAGSEPKYFNYTFDSGEQMRFFLPMLEDTSLQLCQDVTPNTAESKLMQYIAVWREDQQGIVQIGMEPRRLLNAMEKNELSYIFNRMTADEGVTLFAVDLGSGLVSGSTKPAMLGVNAEALDVHLSSYRQGTERGTAEIIIGGEKNHCVLEAVDDVLIGVSKTYKNLYHNIPANMALIIFSLCLLSGAVIFLILRMLDRVVIRGIYGIINDTREIAAGNLDHRVSNGDTPELTMLSSNLNQMVESLLAVTGKLSLVFQNVDIPVAVYEYNQDMRRVLATSKIGEILRIPEEELAGLLADRDRFIAKINGIFTRAYEREKDVYLIGPDEEELRYVTIQSYRDGGKTLGIIVDSTEEITERQRLEQERDIDLLTSLYTRRAFFRRMDALLQQPEELGTAVMLMVDLDNLKYTNDNWGHEYGDKLLQRVAELIRDCEGPEKLAARLGGDEFVLVLYGAASREELKSFLNRLYEQIQEAKLTAPGGIPIPVRVSGGYVFYPDYTGSSQELLALADQAMYQVKKSTKGRFAEYRRPEPSDPTA